jgi:hypothetical protein
MGINAGVLATENNHSMIGQKIEGVNFPGI